MPVLGAALAVAVLVGAGALATVARAAYGPAPPFTNASPFIDAVPGGFARVVATRTIGTAGGNLFAKARGTSVKVVVPAKRLHVPLQFTVSTPDLKRSRAMLARDSHWRGRVVAAVALNARLTDGILVRGRFGGMVMLRLRERRVRAGDRVLQWNERIRRYVLVPRSRVVVMRDGIALHIEQGREVLVLAHAHRVRSRAKR